MNNDTAMAEAFGRLLGLFASLETSARFCAAQDLRVRVRDACARAIEIQKELTDKAKEGEEQ